MRLKVAAPLLSALVAACGGGGGGGGGDAPAAPPAATPYTLTFTPNPLAATAISGTSLAMNVDVQIDRTIPETVNLAVIDPQGVLLPNLTLVALSATRYTATLYTKSDLAVSTHTGTFEVRVCRDAPTVCSSPIAGSPWSLPYTINVTSPPIPPAPPPSPPPPPPPAPPPAPPPGIVAAFSPVTVSINAYADELPATQVSATYSGISDPVFARFVDPDGVFQPNPPASAGPSNITATLYPSSNLAPGVYNGNVELRLCVDLPCTAQHPGSPALLPYSVTVLAATNLTPLVPLAGASEWAMHQGNAAHTGYVPVTLDPSKFSRRWKWVAPRDPFAGGQVSPVVTAAGNVYLVTSGHSHPSTLHALSEHDRSPQWAHEFGTIFRANPPAADGGKVFLATSGHSDTFMWSFTASSGMQLSKVAFNSQWQHYYAPTIRDGAVYTHGGYYGGLLSFKQSDGSLNWDNTTLPQVDEWTPAVSATHAFAYLGGKLYAVDRTSGTNSFEINDPDAIWSSYSVFSAPMLGAGNTVLTLSGRDFSPSNRLLNFDTAGRSIRWSVPGQFLNEPAYANGVIYVANGTQLEARRESDGALLWHWIPPENVTTPFPIGFPPSNVVVTDNLVFVSTGTKVYAISLATKEAVWSYPRGGKLALSPNGILYIATSPLLGTGGSDGQLVAINLQ